MNILGGVFLHSRYSMCLIFIFTTILSSIIVYFLKWLMKQIDVNTVEPDIIWEYKAPENETAREMIDRLSKEIMWKSALEVYLEGILKEVSYLMNKPEKDKDSNEREKLLKYLKEIDNICGFSKDKRDIQIVSKIKPLSDVVWATDIK